MRDYAADAGDGVLIMGEGLVVRGLERPGGERGKRRRGPGEGEEVCEILLGSVAYLCRDGVRNLCGIVGRSWRRPRCEPPAVTAVICYFRDGVAERPSALDDLLRHGGGGWCAKVSC